MDIDAEEDYQRYIEELGRGPERSPFCSSQASIPASVEEASDHNPTVTILRVMNCPEFGRHRHLVRVLRVPRFWLAERILSFSGKGLLSTAAAEAASPHPQANGGWYSPRPVGVVLAKAWGKHEVGGNPWYGVSHLFRCQNERRKLNPNFELSSK
ncbi:hypothetical protein PIB30_040911 [Stylosanthes scabra]|uniref:Uncharacterized protein n=1 Tax=Stylosanthes scabra TaxID=79078 RepID=A0ABU6WD61_9FABA|nr:hypothetical protein [Stylosanthes scabra]